MPSWYEDNSFSIGHTPLVRLNTIGDGKIYAKIESRNPANSVKCRIGASMIWDAEKRGLLQADTRIVEPTSGNTGIALAFVAAARGYRLTLTMPDTMSIERRQLMGALGADLVLTDGKSGMKGAIAKAVEIVEQEPRQRLTLQQFDNPANPRIHEETTGPEIWDALEGNIDVLVSGVGTGGTITGISRYIKKVRNKSCISVAVEPSTTTMIRSALEATEPVHAPHKIQGIGAGFVPANLDLAMIDTVESVTDGEAIEFSHLLMKREGILAGISSGAATAVAARLASHPDYKGKNIVVILPDSSERYLSSILFA